MEDLGHITQVEGVVRLDWNWLQFFLNTGVHKLGSVHNWQDQSFDLISEWIQVPGDNLAENHLNGRGIQNVVSDDVEVSLQALGKHRATTTGWTHGCDEDNVLQLHELLGDT